ncbi:hypothetical protein LCGC14_1296010 [marine sediment metagenome]|uniref:Uncharacterized protein n=1 Tax=marine sediment metagenome TaxID=412755 RepID=A0A0F9NTV5_9ZZZZ
MTKKKCYACKDFIRGDRISIYGFGGIGASLVDWGCFLLMKAKGLLMPKSLDTSKSVIEM